MIGIGKKVGSLVFFREYNKYRPSSYIPVAITNGPAFIADICCCSVGSCMKEEAVERGWGVLAVGVDSIVCLDGSQKQ